VIGNGHAGFGRAASEKDPQGTSPTSYLDPPRTCQGPGAPPPPRRPARPCDRDLLASTAPASPSLGTTRHPAREAAHDRRGRRRPRARRVLLGARERRLNRKAPRRLKRRQERSGHHAREHPRSKHEQPLRATLDLRQPGSHDENRSCGGGSQPVHPRIRLRPRVANRPDLPPLQPTQMPATARASGAYP
jgi:hypothetical protein